MPLGHYDAIAYLAGWTKRPLGGALFYMAAPYHVLDFQMRGALAEYCAFALMPLVALGIRRSANVIAADDAELRLCSIDDDPLAERAHRQPLPDTLPLFLAETRGATARR